MKITTNKSALNIIKPSGLKVSYYLFDEYEVHYNEQPPHTNQDWHHHEKIWESIYLIEGELLAKWREGEKVNEQVVKTGDLIETEHTPHVFENQTDGTVRFLVIKQLLSGENKKELLKTDKVLD